MSLVARVCPDPEFIDAGGRVHADAVAIRTSSGDVLAGELVRRRHGAFPMPATLDEAVASVGFRRSGSWRRCAGESGDEWEADVVSCGARRAGSAADPVTCS